MQASELSALFADLYAGNTSEEILGKVEEITASLPIVAPPSPTKQGRIKLIRIPRAPFDLTTAIDSVRTLDSLDSRTAEEEKELQRLIRAIADDGELPTLSVGSHHADNAGFAFRLDNSARTLTCFLAYEQSSSYIGCASYGHAPIDTRYPDGSELRQAVGTESFHTTPYDRNTDYTACRFPALPCHGPLPHTDSELTPVNPRSPLAELVLCVKARKVPPEEATRIMSQV